jgi:hypothetical protein
MRQMKTILPRQSNLEMTFQAHPQLHGTSLCSDFRSSALVIHFVVYKQLTVFINVLTQPQNNIAGRVAKPSIHANFHMLLRCIFPV